MLALSLEEIAEALSTTVGAVKTALHRARGKLVEPPPDERRVPAPAVLDAFCEAFNAGDIDRVTALLLDHSSVEVVGATTQYGPEAARRTVLHGMLSGVEVMANPEVHGGTVAESSIVLEYVDERSAPGSRLLPSDRDESRECRLRDRFFDLYVNEPMGKIVTDRLRPEHRRDPYGVERAKVQLEKAYDIADEWMRAGPWAVGRAFTMADCAAAPALFYAKQVVPFGDAHRHLDAYFSRLAQRPSFARVVDEAKPYASMFPG